MKEIKGLKNIIKSFETRHVKYGGYAALITLAVITALILANLIVGQFTIQLDMTENKVFSLSEQTIQVLDQINTPVNIYGIWQPGQENNDIMEVLGIYLARNKNLKYQALDPDRNPGKMQNYDKEKKGIKRGSVIVEGIKGFRVIPPEDMYDISNSRGQSSVTGIAVEKRLTSAFLFAGTGESPVVYEITGHQESLMSTLGLKDFIEQENFILKQLNLIQSNIPADASALIIVSPLSDISRSEADKLLDYLEQGGRLLIMADYRLQEHSMFNEVLASYGLSFDYGIVMENDPVYTMGEFFMEIPSLKNHDITAPLLQKNGTVVLPFAMGISENETKRRSVNITPLLVTSEKSWLRSDIYNNSMSKIVSDRSGPVTIAAAVTDSGYIQEDEKQTRIVAIGSSTVMSTPYGDFSIFFQQLIPGNNQDLFMNSLTWLEDRPETLSVRSKSVYVHPMRLNGLKIVIFSGFFVIIIPLAFFVAGLVSWLKRRHL
ncbi:MAG: GldG family protein [Treponema sp.]|jgi:hypothetical protein|nr:GldG family protein [Treponema sp.]